MPNFKAPATSIDESPEEIASIEGSPILEEPSEERSPLTLSGGGGELLNTATDPQTNPDADPYDEREAQL